MTEHQQRRPGTVGGEPWGRFQELAADVRERMENHRIGAESARVAYYVFLSLFPFLLAMFALTGYLGREALFSWIMHELLAAHIATSETWVETEGHGRKVREWTILPSKPDNHWLDCLVGCAVGASMSGIRGEGQEEAKGRFRRKRVSIRGRRSR